MEQAAGVGPHGLAHRFFRRKSTVVISRPDQTSRMFNVRLSVEHFAAIQEIAESQHLPMSTMARAWLPDRLDQERRAS